MITLKEWVKVLKSGEYEQTSGYLRKKDSFCCLGVACDLTKVDWEKSLDKNVFEIIEDDKDYSGYPPETIMADIDWRLIERPSQSSIDKFKTYVSSFGSGCTLQLEPFYMLLARLNDADKSFIEIADFIEETLING